MIFSNKYGAGGAGTVILNAQSNYVGITVMNQFSARDTGSAGAHRAAWDQQCLADHAPT